MSKTTKKGLILSLLIILGLGQMADSPAIEAGLSLLVFLSLLAVLLVRPASRSRTSLGQKNIE